MKNVSFALRASLAFGVIYGHLRCARHWPSASFMVICAARVISCHSIVTTTITT